MKTENNKNNAKGETDPKIAIALATKAKTKAAVALFIATGSLELVAHGHIPLSRAWAASTPRKRARLVCRIAGFEKIQNPKGFYKRLRIAAQGGPVMNAKEARAEYRAWLRRAKEKAKLLEEEWL